MTSTVPLKYAWALVGFVIEIRLKILQIFMWLNSACIIHICLSGEKQYNRSIAKPTVHTLFIIRKQDTPAFILKMQINNIFYS